MSKRVRPFSFRSCAILETLPYFKTMDTLVLCVLVLRQAGIDGAGLWPLHARSSKRVSTSNGPHLSATASACRQGEVATQRLALVRNSGAHVHDNDSKEGSMAIILTDWCARAAYLSKTALHPVPAEEAILALEAAGALKNEVNPVAAWLRESGWEPRFRQVVSTRSERGQGGLGTGRPPDGVQVGDLHLEGPKTGAPCENTTDSDESLPLTCLVGSKSASRRRPDVSCRSWSGPLPPDALLRLGDASGQSPEQGVYVVAPEFHWLLRSRGLGFTRTLLLGCELCGSYTMAPEGIRERKDPLTTPERLAWFVESIGEATRGPRFAGCPDTMSRDASPVTPGGATQRGSDRTSRINVAPRVVNLARLTAPWVLAGCASPREAACALYASLPVRRGGFGLPAPLCNHEVPLGDQARSLLPNRSCIRLDLAWPDHHVAVEYDSHWHDDDQRQLADKDREVAASLEGFRIVPLTPQVAGSQRRLDVFMGQLADLLGARTRPVATSTYERRGLLHRELFTPCELW